MVHDRLTWAQNDKNEPPNKSVTVRYGPFGSKLVSHGPF